MKTAPVTDLKKRLSHYLRLVARGESVTILGRGRPVARLSRVDADDSELEGLVASGLARPPVAPLPKDFLVRRLPHLERVRRGDTPRPAAAATNA